MVRVTALIALLSCVYGLPQPEGETHSQQSSEVKPSVAGVENTGHFDQALVPAALEYGPSFHITDSNIGSIFDDISLLTRGLHTGQWRTLHTVTCAHMNPNNYFIGLMEMYTGPAGDQQVSSYHGYTPTVWFRKSFNAYTLKRGESWSFVTYKSCDGRLVGIHFGTDKAGGGVACGDYNYDGPRPPYISDFITCEGAVLRPPPGRKIVGIYGRGSGNLFAKHQGIIGIGLITAPN